MPDLPAGGIIGVTNADRLGKNLANSHFFRQTFGKETSMLPLFAVASVSNQAGTAVSETTSGLEEFFLTIWAQVPFFIASVIIVGVAHIVSKYLRKIAEKALLRSSQNTGALDLVGKSVQVGVLLVGLIVAMEIMSIDLSLILSAFGFGIGFALKDIIGNYFSGILILIQEPFQIGDVIEVSDTLGIVESVEARNIVLRNFDGQRILIANTDVFTQKLTNFSSHPERRIVLPIGVAYDTDLPKALRVIESTLNEEKKILKKPAPAINFTEFADSSINLEVKFWVLTSNNWLDVRSKFITQVKREFDRAGISIPFPITTLKVDSGEPLQVENLSTSTFSAPTKKVTTALTSSGKTSGKKVSEFGSTDSFDPRVGSSDRRAAPEEGTTANDQPKQPASKKERYDPEKKEQEKKEAEKLAEKEKAEKEFAAATGEDIFDSRPSEGKIKLEER